MFHVLPLKEKLVIVNCVLWSHELRNYAAMNSCTRLTTIKILPVAEGMLVDTEIILEFGKKKVHLNSNSMVNVNWPYR